MDIVDYSVITHGRKTLVFVKINERNKSNGGKLSYKMLHNIIYKISDGYCIADRRGAPQIICSTLESCQEFLNSEYSSNYNKLKKLNITDSVDYDT
jgi:hypothetical protein